MSKVFRVTEHYWADRQTDIEAETAEEAIAVAQECHGDQRWEIYGDGDTGYDAEEIDA